VQSGGVQALAVMPNGDVVAGGMFASAGGIAAQNVARWNGASWSVMAGGLANVGSMFGTEPGGVRTLGVTSNGEVVAAGAISVGATSEPLAVWRNGAWTTLPGIHIGSFGPIVRSIAMLPNNHILAAGADALLGPFVKRWDGVSWQNQGTPPVQTQAVAVLPNGDWVAAGWVVGFQPTTIAKWTGAAWLTLGSIPFTLAGESAKALAPFSAAGPGGFVAGGKFSVVNSQAARSLAVWTGSAWSGDGATFSFSNLRVAVSAEGDTVVGPANLFGSTQLGGVGRWDGTTWQPLGIGLPANSVTDVAILPDGDVVVCGNGSVRRRTGGVWSQLTGGSPPTAPERVLVLQDGRLVAFSQYLGYASFWNGVTWQSLGAARPACVASLPNGDLVAGGFTQSFPVNGRVARWNGTIWTSLDPTSVLTGTVYAIAALPNGDVVAAGGFPFGGGLARYDGATWQPMGAGFNSSVAALAVSPNGELMAGGAFTASGGTACASLARWNGVSWLPVSGGTNGEVTDIAFHPSGDLIVTGSFTDPGSYFARLATPCPAAAVSLGSGCASSGGANRLVATSWPLIGGNFQSRATGLPASSFAFMVLGLAPLSVPLATLLPSGQPGCNLLVMADVLAWSFAAGGAAVFQFAVPFDPSLVGSVFHHQVVPIEYDALGGFVAVTSTNALTLTVGSVQ
jgi:WD40 repeat protein